MTTIGPNFGNELAAAGLEGLPFSWTPQALDLHPPPLTSEQVAAIEDVLAAHDPTKPDELLQLVVTCTSVPAVSGTYSMDSVTVSKIKGFASDASGGLGLPGDSTTFNYPDINRVSKPHTAATIVELYKAMRDFQFAVDEVRAQWGRQIATPIPSNVVTIP